MSVAKGDRSKTSEKLETTEMLKGLCAYTIQICKNERNFPKRDRWILTQHIVREAVKAYTHAKKANAVEVVTMDDYQLRRKHQVKARTCLEALISLIEIAHLVLSLEADRVEYWTACAVNCEKMLAAWRASDRKRYKTRLEGQDPNQGRDTRKGEEPGQPL